MKVSHVKSCSFASWYPTFRSISFKSQIIPLSGEFVKYLLQDGCYLPKSSQFGASTGVTIEEYETNADANEPIVEFPELEKAVKKSVDKLGGKVHPKLNWTSPKDTSWMSCDGTISCRNFGDICLFLKSSSRISRDLLRPFEGCVDQAETLQEDPQALSESYVLVLRRWEEDLRPDAEFRCFVRNRCLLGVSQRQYDQYYPYLSKEKDVILNEISAFYQRHIHDKFPLDDYTFDVYRRSPDRMILVDFNPFGEETESLLFTWKELQEIDTSPMVPIIRVVESNIGIRPASYQHYGISEDFMELTQNGDPFSLLQSIQSAQLEEGCDTSDSD